jgi:hypothetical protein
VNSSFEVHVTDGLNETNRDTWDFLNDISSNHFAKTGSYQVIVTTDISVIGASDDVRFGDGLTSALTFPTVTNNNVARGIIVFRSGATTTLSELICYNRLTAVVTANGGPINITPPANGLFSLSYD